MPNFICTTCGTQFAESDQPPAECKVCTDERQFVGWNGQHWITLDDLRESHRIPAHRKHRVEWTTLDEPTLWLAVSYRD